MRRTSADPRPVTSRAEGFCEAPDRSGAVFFRFGLVGAVNIAVAIRSGSARVPLTRRPKSDAGDVRIAGVREIGATLNVDARLSPTNSKDIPKSCRIGRHCEPAGRANAKELVLKDNTHK
jgi:hypothetical protein